jgi:hypothetical protein
MASFARADDIDPVRAETVVRMARETWRRKLMEIRVHFRELIRGHVYAQQSSGNRGSRFFRLVDILGFTTNRRLQFARERIPLVSS